MNFLLISQYAHLQGLVEGGEERGYHFVCIVMFTYYMLILIVFFFISLPNYNIYNFNVTACMLSDSSNRGIKHDFPFINIRKVPRKVLKTKGEARGFKPSQGTLRMLMNDKIMFDRYYCINSAKHCENEENTGALYFITSSHFPTPVRF